MGWSGMNSGAGAVNVPATLTTVAQIVIQPGASKLFADIYSADFRLTDFDIAVRSHRDSSAFTKVADIASDYTTSISWPLDGCSADLTTLAKTTWATVAMDVKGMHAVRMQANCNTASDTDVSVYWSQR